MARVITQETYDDVVRENIQDLEMNPEDAVKDAIAQFEAQGVNLSNIIKDIAMNPKEKDPAVVIYTKNIIRFLNVVKPIILAHEMKYALRVTEETPEENAMAAALPEEQAKEDYVRIARSIDTYDLLEEVRALKYECNKDLAHRLRAHKEGAYEAMISFLDKPSDLPHELVVGILETLTALMNGQPDLLDDTGVAIMGRLMRHEDSIILQKALRWMGTCCVKHEANRQKIFNLGVAKEMKKIYEVYKTDVHVMQDALYLTRKICLDDDVRVEVSKAHEHARELGINCLYHLMEVLRLNARQSILPDALVAITLLLVRHELCYAAWEYGHKTIYEIIDENVFNMYVSSRGLGLLTAMAGHDDVKRKIVEYGFAPLIMNIFKRHVANAAGMAVVLKCLAMLALREQANCIELVNRGAADCIVYAMAMHTNDVQIQRYCCWAVRNIAARCPELRATFLSLGIEDLINRARVKFDEEMGFDAKSALRDLGCVVKLEEQWKGKGIQTKND